MAIIAGNFAKNDLIIEECILTSCRIGCPVEGGAHISEVRIREVRVYFKFDYFSVLTHEVSNCIITVADRHK